MKRHELPINEPIISRKEVASSCSIRTPRKALAVCTKDLDVTFEVTQDNNLIFEGKNRIDAVSIYNSLP